VTVNSESDVITRVTLGEREIILLGTAHVSPESVKDVERIIKEENPGRVCVELDEARYKSYVEGQSWENLNLGDVLRQGKGFLLLSNLALSSFQKRMGAQTGSKPGEEMRHAVEIAREHGIPFTLADRDITTTLRRAWSKSGFWQKMKLIAALLGSFFSREKLSEEEIEKLKKKSALQDMLDEMADYLPSVKRVLIDERDQFLAASLFNCREEKILGVIGAGHAPGILKWLENLEAGEASPDVSAINHVPPPGRLSKILPWIVPVLVLILFAVGFLRTGWDQSLKMLIVWILANGTLSALGALLALAHPLTVVLSFVAAPITSMNPTVGVGMFSGLLEYHLRKPKVKDFESMSDDIMSLRGFYRNRLTHVLVVFFLSSLGSSIGTFVAVPYIAAIIS
jgi:pheromone shutdown-related protein TraB